MSSPNRSTSDLEDAFSSMNILNYTSVSSDYFPASSGSISFNSSENSNIIPSVISPFYNNPCLKDVQAFYAKELPISSPDPITPPAILTPSLCAEENKVTFATGTLTNDALSWWNAYAQPMGIEQANRTTWTELKRLLKNKYCPRTEIRKMEEELYNLSVKRNDLKPYVRRFQELTTLCPNMVPNNEKLLEAFIGGLPRSIEGNVTASKPQTLEEAINISQRLMDQIIKRDSMQETNNHKRKLEDKRNTIDNNNNYPKYHNNNNHFNNHKNDNYQNNHNNHNRNNDYHHQQNRRQETFKTYTATNGYAGNLPLWLQESILRDELATLETTLEDIQLSSESSSI
ncbi:reverse transcriptase domain-containing protein [Tanacetum coccineum]